jgi:UDP-glucose 4-epimerase
LRVLVTGGAGFIGSHVADLLLARGHEVAVVDDLSSGKRQNIPETARYYQIDILTGCAKVFEDFGPEALSHQAAQMDVRRSVREPDFDVEVNVLGTVRLLENSVRYGIVKVVFASTGGRFTANSINSQPKTTTLNTRFRPTVSRSSPGSATCTSTACNTVSRT